MVKQDGDLLQKETLPCWVNKREMGGLEHTSKESIERSKWNEEMTKKFLTLLKVKQSLSSSFVILKS